MELERACFEQACTELSAVSGDCWRFNGFSRERYQTSMDTRVRRVGASGETSTAYARLASDQTACSTTCASAYAPFHAHIRLRIRQASDIAADQTCTACVGVQRMHSNGRIRDRVLNSMRYRIRERMRSGGEGLCARGYSSYV